MPSADETRYRSGIRSTRLNSRDEKHEDRFGGTKGTCEFISWHFEELVVGLSSDLTRRGNYDVN